MLLSCCQGVASTDDAATVFETEHGHVPLAFLFPDWAARKRVPADTPVDGRAGVEAGEVGDREETVGAEGVGKRGLVDIDDLLGGVLLWCCHGVAIVLLSCCQGVAIAA